MKTVSEYAHIVFLRKPQTEDSDKEACDRKQKHCVDGEIDGKSEQAGGGCEKQNA